MKKSLSQIFGWPSPAKPTFGDAINAIAAIEIPEGYALNVSYIPATSRVVALLACTECGSAITSDMSIKTELTPRVIAGMVKHTTTIFDMFTGQHGKDEESDIVFHVTPSAN